MNFKSTLLSILLTLFASIAIGQESAETPKSDDQPSLEAIKVENSFEIVFPGGAEMGMMGMDMGDDMGMEMDEKMVMGFAGDMGSYGMSQDELFGKHLQLAIQRIRDAKTAAEKSQLMTYTEVALRGRYDQMIQNRQVEINRLKQSLAGLEDDLKRRAAAIDRVIKLQMQSAVLAAEGLLDLNTLSPESTRRRRPESGIEMGN